MNGNRYWKAYGLTTEGAKIADEIIPLALAFVRECQRREIDANVIFEAAQFEVDEALSRSVEWQKKNCWKPV